MLVPAQGCLSLEIEAARTLMAQSTTLQALLLAANSSEALERIYPTILDDDPESPGYVNRPRMLIGFANDVIADRAGVDSMSARGDLGVLLQIDILTDAELRTKYGLPSDAPVTITDHRRDLTNSFGLITQECLNAIAEVGQAGGILEVQRIDNNGHGLADPSENKNDLFYEIVWRLHFEGGL